ncbi:MAG TPA: TM0106 family RecB-like putative nuclease, partial [Gaiellaceae bacterium]|nr:TM0106 family RecB-like putative nuclease [Gaiellaceae bacterium]
SDLTNYLACAHLTQLERRVALGELPKPDAADSPEAALVFRKGEEHERAYLERLRAAGKTVVEIQVGESLDWERAADETRAALAAGVDVVFQGVFADTGWRGIADFLERQPDGSYEAVDTKLARRAKPSHVLQLCFYSEQLARITGRPPEKFHVELGSADRASFRPEEFGAYYRRARARFVDFASADRATEPYPVAHCGRCAFQAVCEAEWEAGDHLSRVARLGRRHFGLLREAGIDTLAALAEAPSGVTIPRLSAQTLAKLKAQAELQHRGRTGGKPLYDLIEPIPETGFALLPEPSEGDLFFDMEGDPFWEPAGGLEYLFGVYDRAHGFQAFWARDREGERRAFEGFVDLVHDRLAADPRLHVYHYASYEVSALRRLMGQHGTREDELDDLLRREVFVDLYAVVRNAIRTSQPRYGLKDLEVFLPIEREAEVKEGGTSILRFEEWMRTRDERVLEEIERYNEEDCRATLLLRDWLLDRREEAIALFGPIPWAEPKPPRETPEDAEPEERVALRAALIDGAEECAPRRLAARLLDYHAREAKPVWWAFFDRLEQTPDELVEDAESIGLLARDGEPVEDGRSRLYAFTFPPQEHRIGAGKEVRDPATGVSPGSVEELDPDARRVVLRRGTQVAERPLPEALIPGGPYRTDAQREALADFARSLLAGDGRYPALESILRRQPHERPVQTSDLAEMKRLVLELGDRHLLVQGPPGSGKTWTGARLAVHLLAHGKRVGVASTSHRAIHNFLATLEDAAHEEGVEVEGLKKATGGNPESWYEGDAIGSSPDPGDFPDGPSLVAGTSWLFARGDMRARLDCLFVDEAGQVSLADALAMGTAARSVVLLGDPNQLRQVVQGTHPDGSGVSVAEHLLGGETTVPEDRGLFLERTYRLHPDVGRFVSEAFYAGRLASDARTAERTTPLGTGLRYLPVEHEGNRQESPEEAAHVREEVRELVAAGVPQREILVVAPYNAHVSLLAEALAAVAPDVRVGTVDKFQGQEADVVLYALGSSSGEDVPRSLEFLFSWNRLNVAVSRARCLAYLVCSPQLLEVEARSIEQMRLANALCRFVEMAEGGP